MSTNDTLTAKANEGSGTDALATLNLGAKGKAGRVALIIDDGTDNPQNAGAANPFPVQVSGGATAAKQDTQQTTLAAIQSATESLLIAAAAIKVAAEALNTKTTAVDTGAIAGTVALDAPTLAALETTGVAVSNFPATQAVSASSLPLPTGAATESTLSAVNAKLPALDSGRVPVSLPPGAGGLTDAELRASPLDVSASALPLPSGAATDATLIAIQETTQSVRELSDTILALLSAVLEKMPRVTGNDQAAVSVEGNVTIGSGTVTVLLQLGGQEALTVARNQMIPMHIYNNITVS